MNPNIQSLVQACDDLKIKYEFIDQNKNLVKVIINDKFYYFNNSRVPLNDRVTTGIAEDKEFTYRLLKDVINCPNTIGYLDPNVGKNYRKYLKLNSLDEIIQNLNLNFSYPVIIKMNKGSKARHVFTVNNDSEALKALDAIYEDTKHYDYIALVQDKIQTFKEYRLMVVASELQFSFCKKEFVNNKFSFIYEDIEDSSLFEKFKDVVSEISKKIELGFMAVDLIEDVNKKLWLLELNSSPSFKNYSKRNGNQRVVKMYKKVLEVLNHD